jgi:hypothetical protein
VIGQLHLSIGNGAAELVQSLSSIGQTLILHGPKSGKTRSSYLATISFFICKFVSHLLHKKVSRSFLVPSLAVSLFVIKHEDGFFYLSLDAAFW